MVELFSRDVKTIGKHINNARKEELDDSTVVKFTTVQKEGERDVDIYSISSADIINMEVKR